MSVGLYDADMMTYTHTAPNLELMKYATYEFKSDIISERIRQRFLYSNNNDD